MRPAGSAGYSASESSVEQSRSRQPGRAKYTSVVRANRSTNSSAVPVAGPELAHCLTELGLIDEYRIYLHPIVLGGGKPYFAGPRPRLRLIANDRMEEDVIRLTYVPA
jgi:riboflavin biosynthesis pyrimidine reductase